MMAAIIEPVLLPGFEIDVLELFGVSNDVAE
jgi:hypothetical protein